MSIKIKIVSGFINILDVTKNIVKNFQFTNEVEDFKPIMGVAPKIVTYFCESGSMAGDKCLESQLKESKKSSTMVKVIMKNCTSINL